MSAAPDLREIVAYHEDMGRELAEFLVMANAGEPISAEDRRRLVEASISKMLADIRDNLKSYGAAPEVVAALCNAANVSFEEKLKALQTSGAGGRA